MLSLEKRLEALEQQAGGNTVELAYFLAVTDDAKGVWSGDLWMPRLEGESLDDFKTRLVSEAQGPFFVCWGDDWHRARSDTTQEASVDSGASSSPSEGGTTD